MNQDQKLSRKQKVALFKYGIISPVLNDSTKNQTQYFKKMAEKIFDVPGVGSKKYKWRTFQSWLRTYRIQGFEGLMSKIRHDKGSVRKIDDGLMEIIKQKLEEFPQVTISLLYRILIDEGHISYGSPCEETIRRFINNNSLKVKEDDVKPRKKFEKPHINELWVADFMHATGYTIENKKKRLLLCTIIDDHSRMTVGANWSERENTETLALTLKQAILTYGLPKLFYCDNGAAFVSEHLQLICARLGIALVHSKPYDSPSRGKIERFFRTVRLNFLPLLPNNVSYLLTQINDKFAKYRDNYHKTMHHSTMQTPLDRYIDDVKNTMVKRISENELDRIFYRTFKRKVNNDATISIKSILFEVPARYIGRFVEVRHPIGQPFDLWIFEDDQPTCHLTKVDVHLNSNLPAGGIKFSQNEQEDASC